MPPLLEVSGLRVWFPIRTAWLRQTVDYVRAVTDVSFTIEEGKTVGLVGESGSGKTTVGKAILKLVALTAGRVIFSGTEVSSLSESEFRPWRRQMQMVFQDPFASLNPRWSIRRTLAEPLRIHFPNLTNANIADRVADLLEKVQLNPALMHRLPHEFSGGQRQRIGIARALAVEPKLIICDEAVSALDVSVQAQIVNLLSDLQSRLGLAYLFISHDLAVVEHLSDYVLVMQRGEIVEQATPERLYTAPQNSYTRELLASVPTM
jgi:oligopeptide transport system ATP-binding protein